MDRTSRRGRPDRSPLPFAAKLILVAWLGVGVALKWWFLSINAILENGKTCECRGRGVRRIWFPLVLYTPRIAQESTTTKLQSDPDIEHAKISVQGR